MPYPNVTYEELLAASQMKDENLDDNMRFIVKEFCKILNETWMKGFEAAKRGMEV